MQTQAPENATQSDSDGLDRYERVAARRRRAYNPLGDIVAPFYLPFVVGISSTTCWRLRRQGKFPEPLRLSVGRVGWLRRDLEQWLRERQAAGK